MKQPSEKEITEILNEPLNLEEDLQKQEARKAKPRQVKARSAAKAVKKAPKAEAPVLKPTDPTPEQMVFEKEEPKEQKGKLEDWEEPLNLGEPTEPKKPEVPELHSAQEIEKVLKEIDSLFPN